MGNERGGKMRKARGHWEEVKGKKEKYEKLIEKIKRLRKGRMKYF
jgi:hypothetical protein